MRHTTLDKLTAQEAIMHWYKSMKAQAQHSSNGNWEIYSPWVLRLIQAQDEYKEHVSSNFYGKNTDTQA